LWASTNDSDKNIIVDDTEYVDEETGEKWKPVLGGWVSNFGNAKNSLGKIKIPIPSMKRQKEIVNYLLDIDAKNKQLEIEIKNNKKQAQSFISGIVKTPIISQDDTSSVNTEPINEAQNVIVSVEEVIIEPTPKVKKVKNPHIIVEDNEV
jgi:restriction endonuclease S subunit